ncbi:Copper chaperone CopZ [Abditibacterium utsteinense]|uniref:Copper chaperone CopZ n=1 Tax=Abditibacterium utsteinense TaxID=1960156 RepID=A0A2S8SPX1_9BACT|nr:heavy metal-associated domain-containing protein [Abditibacterium utsteinense]PQV62819.1 Copper chaperone CopZ [Abditibacterium utsteinense]
MQTIELKISGMTCGSCVSHVTKALQSASGVQTAIVDLASGTARIQGENLDKAALVEAVKEEGYGAQESQDMSPALANSIPLTATGCSCNS